MSWHPRRNACPRSPLSGTTRSQIVSDLGADHRLSGGIPSATPSAITGLSRNPTHDHPVRPDSWPTRQREPSQRHVGRIASQCLCPSSHQPAEGGDLPTLRLANHVCLVEDAVLDGNGREGGARAVHETSGTGTAGAPSRSRRGPYAHSSSWGGDPGGSPSSAAPASRSASRQSRPIRQLRIASQELCRMSAQVVRLWRAANRIRSPVQAPRVGAAGSTKPQGHSAGQRGFPSREQGGGAALAGLLMLRADHRDDPSVFVSGR